MNINLTKVYDTNTGVETDIKDVTFCRHIAKSSNTKNEVYRAFFKNKLIPRKNSYSVEYICPTCKRKNTSALYNIMRKLNNCIMHCNTCKNEVQDKREKQSHFMKHNAAQICRGICMPKKDNKMTISLQEKLSNDTKKFLKTSESFKKTYFQRHLTTEEFETLKVHIISVGNRSINDYEYYPYVSITNQTKFCPYLYDKKDNKLQSLTCIQFKCNVCAKLFSNKDLSVQKGRTVIMCKDCNFCNNTFKIRKALNVQNKSIIYQSKFELKLIHALNLINIIIENGPSVPYTHNNKNHVYRIDFYLPAQKILVECKDNHHWHIANCESGKWQAKEEAALSYAEMHGMKYHIIFPKDLQSFVREVTNKI